MTKEHPERPGLLRFIVAFDEHQTRVREMQDKIDAGEAETEQLKADIEYLKRRLTYFEMLLEREKKRTADEVQTMQARIGDGQDTFERFAPRSMFYRTNAVVHALALAQWPNEADRPSDFDEVASINAGYERWDVNYVSY